MAEFKDKLVKNKHQKLDPIQVLIVTEKQVDFLDWLSYRFDCVVKSNIFSLKRLARIYLADNSYLYDKYLNVINTEKENIRIACNKSCWDED